MSDDEHQEDREEPPKRLTHDEWQAQQTAEKIANKKFRVHSLALKGRISGANRKKRQKLFEVMINDNLTPEEAALKVGVKTDNAIRWVYADINYFDKLKRVAPHLRYQAIRGARTAEQTATSSKDRVYAARALWDFADRIEGVIESKEKGGLTSTTVTVNINNLSNNPLLSAALGLTSNPQQSTQVIQVTDNESYQSLGKAPKLLESQENLAPEARGMPGIDEEPEDFESFSIYSSSDAASEIPPEEDES